MAVAAVRTVALGSSGSLSARERFTAQVAVKNRQVRLLPESQDEIAGAKLAVSSLTSPGAIDARIAVKDSPRPPDDIPAVLARAEIQLDGPGARTALYELRKRAELKLAAFGLGHYMVAIVENDGRARVTIVPCVPDVTTTRRAAVPAPVFGNQQQAMASVTATTTAGAQGALSLPTAAGIPARRA